MNRVAIYQNTITGGGRIKVVNEMVRVLNQRNISPDIYTLRVNRTFKADAELQYQTKRLQTLIYGLYELKIMSLNMQMRRLQNGYDLLINSNNLLLFAPAKIPTISYVHFPREARIKSQYKDIAFPDGQVVSNSGALFSVYRYFLRRLCMLGRVVESNQIVANSEFTKSQLLQVYPELEAERITVIYPPVETILPSDTRTQRRSVVTSLGRFSPDKRQLEQIEIARALPEITFEIIGYVGDSGSRNYFNKCQRYVTENAIKNVNLLPNLASDVARKKLESSGYFLHNLRNEPFGISAVEAIAAGCLPIVHNSGGQKEIVFFDELRFENKEDAIAKLTAAIKNPEFVNQFLPKLQKNIESYSPESFRKAFANVLNKALPPAS